jgi:hypothetical protein
MEMAIELLCSLGLGLTCINGRVDEVPDGQPPVCDARVSKDYERAEWWQSIRKRTTTSPVDDSKYPRICMGACARWVRELTRGADHLRTVAHKIRAPVLLLQAGDDIFVHNHLHQALLRKMYVQTRVIPLAQFPSIRLTHLRLKLRLNGYAMCRTGVPHCNVVCLNNAMHEIMVESDEDRGVAMGHMREFIKAEQPGRNQVEVTLLTSAPSHDSPSSLLPSMSASPPPRLRRIRCTMRSKLRLLLLCPPLWKGLYSTAPQT